MATGFALIAALLRNFGRPRPGRRKFAPFGRMTRHTENGLARRLQPRLPTHERVDFESKFGFDRRATADKFLKNMEPRVGIEPATC